MPGTLTRLARAPRLSRWRIFLALLVAVVTDALQFCFGWVGPVGGFFVDDALDVVAMLLTMWALGFHVLLLLPTFVVKLVPVADMLPTWTGCVAIVIALRKKAERSGAYIDVPHVATSDRTASGESVVRLP